MAVGFSNVSTSTNDDKGVWRCSASDGAKSINVASN
jgi:hypothetical protein